MTNTILRLGAVCTLVLALAACGSSPPSNFYRLTPTATGIGSGQQPALGIGPVSIADFLNRNAIVYSSGGNTLHIAGTELWAEPLNEGITRVVGLNLSGLLDTQNIAYFPWDTRQAPQYGVRIDVLDLDAAGGRAGLTADWVIYHPGDGRILRRRISQFNHELAGPGSTAARLPPAYSALLNELSEDIAAAIRELQQRPAEEAPAGR
jgi:uncharacterized lipoprotein YmbA